MPEPRPGVKTETLQNKEEDEAMKAYAEALNTKKWAKAELVGGAKPQKKSENVP